MRRGIDELRVAHSVVADVKTVAALVWLYAALTAGLLAFLLQDGFILHPSSLCLAERFTRATDASPLVGRRHLTLPDVKHLMPRHGAPGSGQRSVVLRQRIAGLRPDEWKATQ